MPQVYSYLKYVRQVNPLDSTGINQHYNIRDNNILKFIAYD